MLRNLHVHDCITQSTFIPRKTPHEADNARTSCAETLLFIIYINDLPNASKIFHSIMYADDTNLSASLQSIKSTNPNETVDTLINKELSKMSEWLGLNKLSLNVRKSKYYSP